MAEMNTFVLFLGGAKISGAERRIIKTFSLVSRIYKVSTMLVVEADLYKKITEDERLFNALEAFYKIHVIKKFFCLNPVFKIIYLTFLSVYFLVKMKGNFTPYFCLLSPLYAPPMLYMKRIFFEVTSPDIVKMRSMTYMVKLLGKRLTLVAVSEGVESKVLAKLATIKNHTDIKVLSRAVPFSEPVTSAINDSKEKIVVFAHRMIKRKNPRLAVLSFLRVAIERPDWSFHIYGDGPEADEIASVCENSKLANVKFFGRIDDMPSVLKRSMIFVSLIEPDNYPSQSILEAMMYKNALVLSDTGHTASKLYRNNGFLVSLTVESISRALQSALKDISGLQIMGERSHQLLIEEYSLDAYLKDTYRILND